MIIEYSLEEQDFLINQLYIASKSDSIKKKRQRNRIMVPIVYFLLAISTFMLQKTVSSWAIALLALGILWYFFYPMWAKRRYVNHYKAHINEHYHERMGIPVTLEIQDDYLLAKDRSTESKISAEELAEILEIPSLIMIRLKNRLAFPLPKDRLANLDAVRARLQELTNHLNIKYDIDNEWEWK